MSGPVFAPKAAPEQPAGAREWAWTRRTPDQAAADLAVALADFARLLDEAH